MRKGRWKEGDSASYGEETVKWTEEGEVEGGEAGRRRRKRDGRSHAGKREGKRKEENHKRRRITDE